MTALPSGFLTRTQSPSRPQSLKAVNFASEPEMSPKGGERT